VDLLKKVQPDKKDRYSQTVRADPDGRFEFAHVRPDVGESLVPPLGKD
jgi:hypothetical protein